MQNLEKRVFFALEVQAPWPQPMPAGRRLDEMHRHMTVAFLGVVDYGILQPALAEIPKLPFQIGLTGIFDQCLFFPERHPRVVAWHVDWLEGKEQLVAYQQQLISWLQERGFNPDARKEFLPHVTLSRAPFYPHPWKKSFERLPMITGSFHLYESVGNLKYEPIWTLKVVSPFEEIEHTADIAFQINGTSLEQIQLHALIALSFKYPPLLEYVARIPQPKTLDDVIIQLNDIVTHVDARRGCPFKAISFHGDLQELKSGLLNWEMIVDV
ncbi:MAG: hypothetical protein LLG04_00240 [Parachlamydia sp.]|nr:hypothetical protein [Parachlamydia sp.]